MLDFTLGVFDKGFALPAARGFHCLPWKGGQVPPASRREAPGLWHPALLPGPGLGHMQAQEVLIQLHAKLLHGARPAGYYSLDLISNLVGEDRMAKACLRSVQAAVEM